MKWFRSNIRHGSRLALLALAIQFVLSFGHFHGVAAQAAPAIQSGLSRSVAVSPDAARALAAPDAAAQFIQGQQQRQKPVSDHDANDACAICAVIAMANAVLFSTPPLLDPAGLSKSVRRPSTASPLSNSLTSSNPAAASSEVRK